MRLIVLFVLMMAQSALAQDLPALFRVTGVDADDVLNIRQNPRATAEKIGELAHDAMGVEVVALSESGDWGLVNVGEGAGWVRMRFLGDPGQLAPGETYFDRVLACFGTEPFWGLDMAAGLIILTGPDRDPIEFSFAGTTGAAGRGAHSQAAILQGEAGQEALAVVRRQACGDGMSDRRYGLNADVVLSNPEGAPELLTGCCSISR